MSDIEDMFRKRPPKGDMIMFALQEGEKFIPIYREGDTYRLTCKTQEGNRIEVDFDTLYYTNEFGHVLSLYKDKTSVASISGVRFVDIQYHKDYRNIKWRKHI